MGFVDISRVKTKKYKLQAQRSFAEICKIRQKSVASVAFLTSGVFYAQCGKSIFVEK